mmetsp:Transcript_7050/g.22077  ORF Transcript_7050/g.22077 Transcript_7050/m.22077 type:complete len:140 (-) Transcript_7050:111-530(-)
MSGRRLFMDWYMFCHVSGSRAVTTSEALKALARIELFTGSDRESNRAGTSLCTPIARSVVAGHPFGDVVLFRLWNEQRGSHSRMLAFPIRSFTLCSFFSHHRHGCQPASVLHHGTSDAGGRAIVTHRGDGAWPAVSPPP